MRHTFYLGLLMTALFCATGNPAQAQEELMPSIEVKEGFVPTKEVAIEIALAVWKPIYGEKQLLKQKPYQAELKNGIWHVRGTLPEGWKGGTAIARINKQTGCILFINHGK
jgi:hypothetical protein